MQMPRQEGSVPHERLFDLGVAQDRTVRVGSHQAATNGVDDSEIAVLAVVGSDQSRRTQIRSGRTRRYRQADHSFGSTFFGGLPVDASGR